MALSAAQTELLTLYASHNGPVQSRIFETPPPAGTAEGDPAYDQWCAHQLALGEASISLFARRLITLVGKTEDGVDIVQVSADGRTALVQSWAEQDR